eukprot:360328-Chlamydomonas_euryale.AAC.11
MVEDVTSSERAAEARQDGILPTTRLQMGFGIQRLCKPAAAGPRVLVLVTMGTFFALAYVSTKYYLRWDELWVSCSMHVPMRCTGYMHVCESASKTVQQYTACIHPNFVWLVVLFVLKPTHVMIPDVHLYHACVQAGLSGAIGLTFGLLLETLLLILRSNMPPPLRKQYPHLFVKAQQPETADGMKAAAELQPASMVEGKKQR